jgi:hypothetical protein
LLSFALSLLSLFPALNLRHAISVDNKTTDDVRLFFLVFSSF